MSECSVKFPEPVSKGTVNKLVVEYLKFILYSRGQCPLPLDQLKESIIKSTIESEPATVDSYPIFYDNSPQCDPSGTLPKSNATAERKKQKYEATIKKFDDFFEELFKIMQDNDVLEIVMNLGSNMMSPKELHRITLPAHCNHTQCSQNLAPFHKCRLFFFRSILKCGLLQTCNSDILLPITVLLFLKNDSLTDHMEHKHFYVPPTRCKQMTVHFGLNCCQGSSTNLQDGVLTNSSGSPSIQNKGMWVKLKPDLKGFKDISPENKASSS